MKLIKGVIGLGWLMITILVIRLIFIRNFIHFDLQWSVDNWTEESVLVILNSAWQAGLAILCCGLLAMFTNFMFIKLFFSKEIYETAYQILKQKRKTRHLIKQQQNWIREQTLKNKTFVQKIIYHIKLLFIWQQHY